MYNNATEIVFGKVNNSYISPNCHSCFMVCKTFLSDFENFLKKYFFSTCMACVFALKQLLFRRPPIDDY